MGTSHWHRLYRVSIAAPRETLFDLIADLPEYPRWLPPSDQYASTTVEPYPVRLGSRYHDGKPSADGRSWWGTVTAYAPPSAIDFHHEIAVREAQARVDVDIHYSFEPAGDGTEVVRWLALGFRMPFYTRPARALVIRAFDRENVRTLAALKAYAERPPA